jgi:hypothetical protein
MMSKNLKNNIYNTIILPAFLLLYGSETLSLTSKEEYGLDVFENRVLRSTFGSKRDEMAEGWSNLHIEDLHNLYSKSTKWIMCVARMREKRNAYIASVRKPKRKRSLGRPRHRSKMNLREVVWGGMTEFIWL